MDGNDQKAIEFRNVSFRVADGKTLLSAINLEIYRGETLVLLGRSGCGKTTTLKLINRLLDPTEGEVHVEGRATTEWEPIRLRRRIGYVIQEIGLFPHFTVQENVSLVPVGVARALAADPPIMLLDEPFGALDPITRRELQQEFCSLQRRLKKTLVFVTHDVQEAFLLASRIGLLKDGKMVLLGQPDELLKSDDPEARAFALCLRDPRASETAP
ncbi:MAG: ATP-binding cassette domain-containing protein [Deltaproteobacteria bacterium]|nr:ATP-binding cassette domain-containing protein [Deltaproteobacteria bacterium]